MLCNRKTASNLDKYFMTMFEGLEGQRKDTGHLHETSFWTKNERNKLNGDRKKRSRRGCSRKFEKTERPKALTPTQADSPLTNRYINLNVHLKLY